MPDKVQEGTVSLYLRMSPAVKAQLQEYAVRNDMTMNDAATLAILDFLATNDPQELRPRGK